MLFLCFSGKRCRAVVRFLTHADDLNQLWLYNYHLPKGKKPKLATKEFLHIVPCTEGAVISLVLIFNRKNLFIRVSISIS